MATSAWQLANIRHALERAQRSQQAVFQLTAAKAAFACELHAEHDGGDHRIIVGRVTRLGLDPARESLLYLHGRYRRVHVGS